VLHSSVDESDGDGEIAVKPESRKAGKLESLKARKK